MPLACGGNVPRSVAVLALLACAGQAMSAERLAPVEPCPGAHAAIVERFTSADCTDCWQADAPTPAKGIWVFDWISPTTADAAMSPAAPLESRERAQRAGGAAPVDQQTLVVRGHAAAPRGLHLAVESGPAWAGYFGLQLSVGGRVPAGATGWMALVERLPAGGEGSAVARELVRAVAGPLPLDAVRVGRPLQHLAALRWPETAQVSRLVARGWLESADGHMLAVVSEHCALP